jgi:hypothetical protein
LFPLFATVVAHTGSKFAVGNVDVPLVSTTLAKPVTKFAVGVVDIGGKFAASVVDGAP